MRKAIGEWLIYCRRNFSPATTDQYDRVLTRFRLYAGDKPLAQITISHLEQYVDTLLKERCRNTVNSHLTALKSFWTWQHKRYGVPNLAAQVPMLAPQDPEQRVLTEEEYAKVLPVCEPVEKDVIQFFAHTGLRRGELLCLCWNDIAPDMLSMRIHQGKGRKPRTVPLDLLCRDILERNRADNALLFLQRYGGPSAMDRLCRRLAVRCGIAAFGPHALRHLFTTRMFKAGRPAKIISKILGHSSLAITEAVYCHILPQDVIGTTEGFLT